MRHVPGQGSGSPAAATLASGPGPGPALLLATFAAVALPTLVAYNLPPSSTQLNQLLALGLWGFLLMSLPMATAASGPAPLRGALRAAAAPAGALGLLAVAALGSWAWGSLPFGLAVSGVGVLGVAVLALAAGAGSAQADASGSDRLWAAFAWALLAAGLLGAVVAVVQVFLPDLADGNVIARSGLVGRAVGNVRQPNHLSTVLLWALIAAVPLVQTRRLPRALGALATALLVLGVVLTASRTGLVGIALLALWGALDRRLPGALRLALLAVPLLYLLGWMGMAQWADATAHTFGGEKRLAEADLSASRFGIWSNTLELIRAQPWAGVGFGEFNLAWSLTPFPGRPVAFFDHTHNLPLHLAVELGLPLATLVLGLLLTGLWQAWRRNAWGAPAGLAQATSPGARPAWMLVVMVGLHSLLEYPLWYSYFLLPTAFAWGYALGAGPSANPPASPPTSPARRAAPSTARAGEVPRWAVASGAALMLATALALADYARVVAIFSPGEGAAPLAERIRIGQTSPLFAHHADYAAATTAYTTAEAAAAPPTASVRLALSRGTHYLLDTRLMMAWAQALAATGDPQDRERARHLAQRLREFRNPASADFLAVCSAAAPASAPPPFQCEPPTAPLNWRDFQGAP